VWTVRVGSRRIRTGAKGSLHLINPAWRGDLDRHVGQNIKSVGKAFLQ
jgi:hypothetical protein